jgi:hypothetical protein
MFGLVVAPVAPVIPGVTRMDTIGICIALCVKKLGVCYVNKKNTNPPMQTQTTVADMWLL